MWSIQLPDVGSGSAGRLSEVMGIFDLMVDTYLPISFPTKENTDPYRKGWS